MTDHDAIAAKVRQDMETGTPGPWVHDDQLPQWINMRDDNGAVWNVATAHVCCGHPVDGSAANARRIATLPDLEAAYLDLYDEVKRLRSERDALRAHPYLPAEEISAIERGNRRWHGEYDTTVSVRWEPYKPDGQRQMKAKGRWQTMTFNSSDYFRWENCNRPAQVRQALKGQTDD